MSGGPVIRVLVIDDHAIVRTDIRRALGPHADLAVVGEAARGAELLSHAALSSADATECTACDASMS